MRIPLDGVMPRIHETAYVAPNATLVGNVEVGPQSSVWFGAVVRADSGKIKIGSGSNIQDNSVLHADDDAEIGDNVTIGHGVVCHAKSIGDGTLLGNGSVLNDGVVVGKNCLIAAGTVITENTVIEDDQLVRGIPGKAIGKLRDRHRQLLTAAAQSYVNRIARYRD